MNAYIITFDITDDRWTTVVVHGEGALERRTFQIVPNSDKSA